MKINVREVSRVSENKLGRIRTNGMQKMAHEYATASYLTLFGIDIDFLKQTNTVGTRNADFMIFGTIWESKSPDGRSRNAIERNIKNSGHQAENLVLDLRRFGMKGDQSEAEAIKQFTLSRNTRRMLLITKDGRLLDIKK